MGTGLHSVWMYVPVYMDIDRRRIVKIFILPTLEVKTLHLWTTQVPNTLDWLYSVNTTILTQGRPPSPHISFGESSAVPRRSCHVRLRN